MQDLVKPRDKSSVWREVPWPLWVFAVGQVLLIARVVLQFHGPLVVTVLYPVLTFGGVYFLLRGVRWVWLVTVGVIVLGLAFELVSGSIRWWGNAIGLVELVLLLLPVTRRYFSSEGASTTIRATLPSSLWRLQKVAAQGVRRWTPGVPDQPELPIVSGFLVFYVGMVLAVFVFVVGGVTLWHEGAGQGSVLVDVLWHAVTVVSRLLELSFVVLLAVWGYRRLRDRKAAEHSLINRD